MTGVDREKCARAFASGVDAKRDLLDRDDLHDVLCQAHPVTANNRLSEDRYAWLRPTKEAHARESQLGVLSTNSQHVKCSSAPEPVRKEAAAAYLAYQARTLAAHANSEKFILMLDECVRHNRNLTV